jgi:hypothetical protein
MPVSDALKLSCARSPGPIEDCVMIGAKDNQVICRLTSAQGKRDNMCYFEKRGIAGGGPYIATGYRAGIAELA